MTDIKRVWIGIAVAIIGIIILILVVDREVFWERVVEFIFVGGPQILKYGSLFMIAGGLAYAKICWDYHKDPDYDSQGNWKGADGWKRKSKEKSIS